ncbi:MAG: hypothetical protein CMP66_02550 [Flavobacteriales bacterium]|mgnify:FL=1|nr:hypothetical protein [Flavobacteriales bacterium]|tara:strand:+ start:8499 stop:9518 length:1020 start_codon:yes stop_codon:yes gene_type:complete
MGQSIHLCEGDSLQEYWVIPSDAANNAMQWDFIVGNGAQFVGAQNTSQTIIDFPIAGTYVLQFSETNQYGCVGAVILDIVVHSLPAPSFSYETICVGQPISFQNTTTASSALELIQWELNGLTDTSYHISRTFLQEGLYPISLYVEDEWGCASTYSEVLEVHSNPESDFYFTPSEPSATDPLVQFINLSTPNTQAIWDFGNNTFSTDWSPAHTYENAGWYDVQLKVEDDNGCQDSIQKSLLVKSDLLFYVPDAFTPNSDGDNDMFGPEGFQMDRWQSYHLKVWSQWGELIFESTDVNQFWDGKTKSGLYAPNDTYVWSIRINDELGKQTHHTGTVNLLR